MGTLNKVYCRTFQKVMKFSVNFLDWTPPQVIKGAGAVKKLPELVIENCASGGHRAVPCNTGKFLIIVRYRIKHILTSPLLTSMQLHHLTMIELRIKSFFL